MSRPPFPTVNVEDLTSELENLEVSPMTKSRPRWGWLGGFNKGNKPNIGRNKPLPSAPSDPRDRVQSSPPDSRRGDRVQSTPNVLLDAPLRPGTPLATSSHRPVVSVSVPNLSRLNETSTARIPSGPVPTSLPRAFNTASPYTPPRSRTTTNDTPPRRAPVSPDVMPPINPQRPQPRPYYLPQTQVPAHTQSPLFFPMPNDIASPDIRLQSHSAPPQILSTPPAPPLLASPAPYPPAASPLSFTPSARPPTSRTHTPTTPVQTTPARRRPRATSSPASPTALSPSGLSSPSSIGTAQCAGVTKAQARCTRQVKALSPLACLAPDVPLERYCFQHSKDMLQPTGFYSHQETQQWVNFEDFIPSYLQQSTQVLLRNTMETPPSDSDEDGYIYAYEQRQHPSVARTRPASTFSASGSTSSPSGSETVKLKVGRSTNLVKRLGEWTKQCGKEVVLRGFWPSDKDDDGNGKGKSMMRGKVAGGQKVKCTHRLERLIHIELADLSLYAPYLQQPNANPASPLARGSSTPGSSTSKAPQPKRRPLTPCEDCGKIHKEIFSFERIMSGQWKGKEWEAIVQPVIERWGYFVEMYL